jgi:hypothetical protein
MEEILSPKGGGGFFNQQPDNDQMAKRKKQDEYRRFLDAQSAVKKYEKEEEKQQLRNLSPRPTDRLQSQQQQPTPSNRNYDSHRSAPPRASGGGAGGGGGYGAAPVPQAPVNNKYSSAAPSGGGGGGDDDYFAILQAMERERNQKESYRPNHAFAEDELRRNSALEKAAKMKLLQAQQQQQQQPPSYSRPEEPHNNYYPSKLVQAKHSAASLRDDSVASGGLKIGLSSVEQNDLKKAKQSEYRQQLDSQQKSGSDYQKNNNKKEQQQQQLQLPEEYYAPSFGRDNMAAAAAVSVDPRRQTNKNNYEIPDHPRAAPRRNDDYNNDINQNGGGGGGPGSFMNQMGGDAASKRKKQEDYRRFLDAQVTLKQANKEVDDNDGKPKISPRPGMAEVDHRHPHQHPEGGGKKHFNAPQDRLQLVGGTGDDHIGGGHHYEKHSPPMRSGAPPAPLIDRKNLVGYPDNDPGGPRSSYEDNQSMNNHLFGRRDDEESSYGRGGPGEEPGYGRVNPAPAVRRPTDDNRRYGGPGGGGDDPYHQQPDHLHMNNYMKAPPVDPRLSAGPSLLDNPPPGSYEEGNPAGGYFSPGKSPKPARQQMINDIYGKSTSHVVLNETPLDAKWKPSGKNQQSDRQKASILDQRAALDAQKADIERRKFEEKEKEKLENEKYEQRMKDEKDKVEREKNEEKEKKKVLLLQQQKKLEELQQITEKEALARKNIKKEEQTPSRPPAKQQQPQQSQSQQQVDPRRSQDKFQQSQQHPQQSPYHEVDESRYDHINSPLKDQLAAMGGGGGGYGVKPAPKVNKWEQRKEETYEQLMQKQRQGQVGGGGPPSGYGGGVGYGGSHYEDEGMGGEEDSYGGGGGKRRNYPGQYHQENPSPAPSHPHHQQHSQFTPDAVDSFVSNFQQKKGTQDNNSSYRPPRNPAYQQQQQQPQSSYQGGYQQNDVRDSQDSFRNSRQYYNDNPSYRQPTPDSEQDLSIVCESKLIPANPWRPDDLLHSLMPTGSSIESANYHKPPSASASGRAGGGVGGGVSSRLNQPKPSFEDPVLAGKIGANANQVQKRRTAAEDLEKSISGSSHMVYGSYQPPPQVAAAPAAKDPFYALLHQSQVIGNPFPFCF